MAVQTVETQFFGRTQEVQVFTQDAVLARNVSERRRSPRFSQVVPVVVRGGSPEGRGFLEVAFAISISAHGALVVLAARVGVGQALVLMNPRNREERDVRVTRIGCFDGKATGVGIEFINPAPDFWQIGAPPQKSHSDRSRRKSPPKSR
jgi:hypothetical protein